MIRLVERELHVGPRGFDQAAQRIRSILLGHLRDLLVEFLVAFGGDRGDEGLLVGEVRVGRGVTDARLLRHLPQAERAHAFFGEDVRPGLDQGVLQIAVVVTLFPGHG